MKIFRILVRAASLLVLVGLVGGSGSAWAGDPPADPTPIGYGEAPPGAGIDPIFVPFGAEYIVTASEGSTSYYFPSNGDGTFGSRSPILSGLSDGAAIADFDNDGDFDFVIGAGFDTIFLYRNDGGGVFNPVTIASSVPTFFHTQMRAADFNKDGRMDFTSGSLWASGGPQRVYLNQGGLSFAAVDLDSSWINDSVYGREVGDFNEDGNPDIAILGLYGSTTGKVRIYYGKGDGTFDPPIEVIDLVAIRPGTSGTSCLASGDFDLNGDTDLLVGCSYTGISTGRVYLFLGDGTGGFTFKAGPEADGGTLDVNDGVTIGQGGTDAYDFDKDGRLDIVSVNWNGAKLFFHKGKGDGTFHPRVLVDSGLTATAGVIAPPELPLPPAEPELVLFIEAPESLEVFDTQYSPNPFEVRGIISHLPESPVGAEGVEATITLREGLILVEGETPTKVIGDLPVGESATVSWMVFALPKDFSTSLGYDVTVTAENISQPLVESRRISIPGLIRRIVIFLQGLNSELICTSDSVCVGAGGVPPFAEIRAELREMGYAEEDFIDFSYRGHDKQEGCIPKSYLAKSTWEETKEDVDKLFALIDCLRGNISGRFRVVFVGHSKGGIIAFEFLREALQRKDYDLSIIEGVITLDSPHKGVPADIIKLWPDFIPVAGVGEKEKLINPFTKELQRWFKDFERRELEGQQIVAQADALDIRVITLGNADDLFFFPFQTTQIFLTAEECLFFLGNDLSILDPGHSRILVMKAELITELIGAQRRQTGSPVICPT